MRRARLFSLIVASMAGALAVSGCGDTPASQYARAVKESFTGRGARPPAPTRAQLNELPYAVVSVRREGSKDALYMVAITNNEGYITYTSPGGRSVTLRGAALTGHHSLGYDFMGYTSSPNDPLIAQAPLADWPTSVERAYRMRAGDGRIYTRSVVCVPVVGAQQTVTILEVDLDLVEVEDRCRGGREAFTNRYWVDPATGYVWKSTQWTGPQMFPLTVEVIKPYARS